MPTPPTQACSLPACPENDRASARRTSMALTSIWRSSTVAKSRAGRPSRGDGGDLRRALRAPPRRARDHAQALRALAGDRLLLRRTRPRDERVHRLYHEEEDHRGDGGEGEQGVQEAAVQERAAVDVEAQLGEVRLPEDGRNDRREDVCDERVDEGHERG